MAPKSPREAVQKTKDIRDAVEKELKFDPLIDASGITVKNMGGDVALNGTVPSYPQYQEAAAAAKRVKGVTGLHNHLMVDLPYASYRDDVILTTAANNALTMLVSVPGNVEASASEGDVWLTGTVGNRFERDAAEQAVAGLTGVRGIVDDIEIFSDVEAADAPTWCKALSTATRCFRLTTTYGYRPATAPSL
jgi:osmotically-inducible protein OsmY